jgi:hypothetical protein
VGSELTKGFQEGSYSVIVQMRQGTRSGWVRLTVGEEKTRMVRGYVEGGYGREERKLGDLI